MKKLFNVLNILVAVSFFVACSDDCADSINMAVGEDLCSAQEVNAVSIEEALNVAAAYFPAKPTSRGSEVDVQMISEPGMSAALYVINFANDGGFILVSGKKTFSPVLAFSDRGHFDIDNMPETLSTWVDECVCDVYESINLSSDSIESVAKEWARFAEDGLQSRSSERPSLAYMTQEEYDAFKEKAVDSIDSWTRQGFKVYEYLDYIKEHDSITPMGFNIGEHAHGWVHPLYEADFWALTYVLERNTTTVSGMDRSDEPQWGQRNGYNQSFPMLSNGELAYAGCGPIALGQLMYKSKYPRNINWAEVTQRGVANRYTSDFIYEIALKAEAEFETQGTKTNHKKYKSLLESYGYAAKDADFNEKNLVVPAIICSKLYSNNVYQGAHAWLVTTGSRVEYEDYIEVWVFDDHKRLDRLYAEMLDFSRYSNYYVNWGWSGNYDGFYNHIGNACPSNYDSSSAYFMVYAIQSPR